MAQVIFFNYGKWLIFWKLLVQGLLLGFMQWVECFISKKALKASIHNQDLIMFFLYGLFLKLMILKMKCIRGKFFTCWGLTFLHLRYLGYTPPTILQWTKIFSCALPQHCIEKSVLWMPQDLTITGLMRNWMKSLVKEMKRMWYKVMFLNSSHNCYSWLLIIFPVTTHLIWMKMLDWSQQCSNVGQNIDFIICHHRLTIVIPTWNLWGCCWKTG